MSLRSVIRRSAAARYLYARSFILRCLTAPKSGHSFSQAGEDLIVENLLRTVEFFVDIGANDGISGSNTFYFALRGAHGICFEPVSETYTKLRWLYLLNPRVRTVQCGISDKSRTAEIVAADFLSSLPETEDKEHVSEGTKDIDERHK